MEEPPVIGLSQEASNQIRPGGRSRTYNLFLRMETLFVRLSGMGQLLVQVWETVCCLASPGCSQGKHLIVQVEETVFATMLDSHQLPKLYGSFALLMS